MRPHPSLALLWMLVLPAIASAQEKLPDGAVARLGVHRLRAPAAILDSAFSPDGRTLVVAFESKDHQPNVILFDIATGLERKRLDIRGVRHIAMTRHKPLMAVDTDAGFEVWDLATEKPLQQWDYPECIDEASALAISPDGTQVVAATPMLLRWNAATGEALTPFRPRPSPFRMQTLQFSSDGSKLLTSESRDDDPRRYFGFSEFIPFFSALDSNSLFSSAMVGPRMRLLHHTAWTIGSHWIFAPSMSMVAVWDVKAGTRLLEFGNDSGMCAFSADGTMVALNAGYQKSQIVRLERGWPHVGTVDSGLGLSAFTVDGKRLLNFSSGSLWDIAARKAVHHFEDLVNDFLGNAESVRMSPDGRLAAVVANNHVRLLDLTTGKEKTYPTGHPGPVVGLAYSPAGKRLATFSRDTILLFDAQSGKELRRWIAHKSNVVQMAFSHDGKLLASAASASDEQIILWDADTGAERRRLACSPVTSLAFMRDSKTLLCASGNLERWNVETAKLVDRVEVGRRSDQSMPTVSPNGDFMGSLGGERDQPKLHVLNLRTIKLFPALDLSRHNEGAQTAIWGVKFSPDGKALATCDTRQAGAYAPLPGASLPDTVIRIWETATQREIMRFSKNKMGTNLLAIAADGRTLANGSGDSSITGRHGRPINRSVILRDLSTGHGSEAKDTDRPIAGHLGAITCLAFSPDGKFLATGGSDQVVYIWRVEHFVKRTALPEIKADVAELWQHLADADAGKAYQAMAQLQARPKETLALLRKNLKPAAKLDAKVVAQHLRDLSSGNFAVRQQASSALELAGDQATQPVQKALKNPASLEVKRRLEALLEKLDRPLDLPSQRQAYRSLILLERIDTPEARQLLAELAHGAPTAWLTIEAQNSLPAR